MIRKFVNNYDNFHCRIINFDEHFISSINLTSIHRDCYSISNNETRVQTQSIKPFVTDVNHRD